MTLRIIGWIMFQPYKYYTYQKLLKHGSHEWYAYEKATTVTPEEYENNYKNWE